MAENHQAMGVTAMTEISKTKEEADMSKLNIDQQTIKELFVNKRSDFLIPDYQRPYAWGEAECQTL